MCNRREYAVTGSNLLLTLIRYAGVMIRYRRDRNPVTLVLRSEEGISWPLRLSADCVQFIGRYRRIENFGPASGLLHFLPGHIA